MLWLSSCNILYTLKKVVDHVNNNTTVNLCLLDMEYRWNIRLDNTWNIIFDQINHCAFNKTNEKICCFSKTSAILVQHFL
jgi:hypothetical protein